MGVCFLQYFFNHHVNTTSFWFCLWLLSQRVAKHLSYETRVRYPLLISLIITCVLSQKMYRNSLIFIKHETAVWHGGTVTFFFQFLRWQKKDSHTTPPPAHHIQERWLVRWLTVAWCFDVPENHHTFFSTPLTLSCNLNC